MRPHCASTQRADLDPVRGDPDLLHTGVVWQGTPSRAVRRATPRVLISLSTCAFAGQRATLQRVLDAVGTLRVEAVVTSGPAIDTDGLRIPPNTTLHDWLDHDEVLRTTSLVIGHGGHSTTMRALSFGVPVLVLPSNPAIDQQAVGEAVARAGVGAILPKRSRPDRIASEAQRLLESAEVRTAAEALGEDIRRQDGAEIAADALEAVLPSSTTV